MTTGWLKTLNGADVYTDDGEWYFDHATQGWFHDPALAVLPPRPPASVPLRAEIDRLTHGWPTFRSALLPRKGEHTKGIFWGGVAWILRGWIFGCLGWIVLHIVPVAQVFAGNVVSIYYDTGSHGDAPAWASDDSEHSAYIFGVTLFLVVASFFAFWMLYTLRTYDVDPHKGYALTAATVAYGAYAGHKRHQRLDQRAMADYVKAQSKR